ncbi:unnamed protein product, partial [marine sediment metagenome]
EPINRIAQAGDLFNKIKKINIDYNKENLIVFYLNTKNQVLHSEIVHMGGLDACIVDPKTIFRIALLKNSNGIIIAHNHPSGDLKPSTEDIDIFERLKQVGDIISLKCLDSIIFNKKEFYSMHEM